MSGTRDEQGSVLNVPLGLTHLSVRMILGLISPNDWILGLRHRESERFKLPAPNAPVSPSLQCEREYLP